MAWSVTAVAVDEHGDRDRARGLGEALREVRGQHEAVADAGWPPASNAAMSSAGVGRLVDRSIGGGGDVGQSSDLVGALAEGDDIEPCV